MNASASSPSGFLRKLCNSTAILMTLTGLALLISLRVLGSFARDGRFIGEMDALSIALIFGGIAVALKAVEIRSREEQDSSADSWDPN